jgi:DNA-binding response OmpR family regulator
VNTRCVRVLVAGQPPFVLKQCAEEFARYGWTLVSADSGRGVVALLHGMTLSAVVLPLDLPDLEGPDLCRTVRMIAADPPPLVALARGSDVARARARRAGFDAFVPDRMSVVALCLHLNTVMRAGRLSRGAGSRRPGDRRRSRRIGWPRLFAARRPTIP